MHRSAITLATLVATAALTLTACGDDGGTSNTPGATTPSSMMEQTSTPSSMMDDKSTPSSMMDDKTTPSSMMESTTVK